jgi:hypothetical protein
MRIRIKLKGKIRTRILIRLLIKIISCKEIVGSGSGCLGICIKLKGRIRIRINVMQIRNTSFRYCAQLPSQASDYEYLVKSGVHVHVQLQFIIQYNCFDKLVCFSAGQRREIILESYQNFPSMMLGSEGAYVTFGIKLTLCTSQYTDKKLTKIFLKYKKIQSGAVAKSYMRKGFLIYEEMRKYFPIYEEAPL